MTGRLTAVPAGSMVDPCCCACPTMGNWTSINSGYNACGPCIVDNSGVSPVYYKEVSHTGITGSQTIPVTDPTSSGVIGTITLQKYSDSLCSTPDGAPETVDVTGTIGCDNGAVSAGIAFVSPFTGGNVVLFNADGIFGVAMDNQFDCGGPPDVRPAWISTVTVTPP